ncbi:conserved hypothetical protein [Capnocytophaga canimorsus]|uniref:Uncharacterized protein n=1 Tax=Capnocytophaga canimorsus TaxID=28188 RepID=A0A0B7HJ66_9FLAO|nr:conserved hypothetical protein [Capnocytophaga canimorsus]
MMSFSLKPSFYFFLLYQKLQKQIYKKTPVYQIMLLIYIGT